MSLSRLLVVDDDPNVAAFLAGALRKKRVEVVAARSGEEALERFEQAAPDAIFLDVRLPGMSGLETFAALRKREVDVPVVIVTSHASMETAVEAMKEGAYDFLTKPLRLAPCEALIERLDHDGRLRESGPPSDVSHDRRGRRLIGKNSAMIEVYKTIGRVARTDVTVLITGESGTGKELVARLIHDHGARCEGPWQVVNCAAIPEQLLESELFGHEKGAFTGAIERRIGKFERAHGGTVFLDEIGDMTLGLQSKILRVLEERSIERVGSRAAIPVDVRVVAATHQDLVEAVEEGRFRMDLYYRLAVVMIRIPALRERREDIRPLTDHFLRLLQRQLGRRLQGVSPDVYRRLEEHDWPGNVRELKNVLERAMIVRPGATLTIADLPALAPVTGERGPRKGTGQAAERLAGYARALVRARLTAADVERQIYRAALEETNWNLTRVGERLDVHRNTVRRKIAEHGLEPPDAAQKEVG